jgi:hypothetical protein
MTLNKTHTELVAQIATELQPYASKRVAQRAAEYCLIDTLIKCRTLPKVKQSLRKLLKTTKGYGSYMLLDGFVWFDTPEGHDFWAGIYWGVYYSSTLEDSNG